MYIAEGSEILFEAGIYKTNAKPAARVESVCAPWAGTHSCTMTRRFVRTLLGTKCGVQSLAACDE